jgi:hypothetical protein
MEKLLILKLSDKDRTIPFGNDEELVDRANGSWRISLSKINGVKRALLLFRGRVLEEYEIGSKIIADTSNSNRLTFDMTIVEHSDFKNKILDYRTANPASVVEVEKIKYRDE